MSRWPHRVYNPIKKGSIRPKAALTHPEKITILFQEFGIFRAFETSFTPGVNCPGEEPFCTSEKCKEICFSVNRGAQARVGFIPCKRVDMSLSKRHSDSPLDTHFKERIMNGISGL